MKPRIIKGVPGPKSKRILDKMRLLNIGYSNPYPFVHSREGRGPYFKDIDGNMFLDFGSQIASNPLGYNHPDLINAIKGLTRQFPIKYAGQDFTVPAHMKMIEELLSITPHAMKRAFLCNSGAEAVENCIKIALRNRKNAKFGVAFEEAFHGRTLGALSCTSSKAVQKKHFLRLPVARLPFDESGAGKLDELLVHEADPSEIGFIIAEPIQGEGGYNVAPQELLRGLGKFANKYDIPLIMDEVQSGMGRTGRWWAFEHYGIAPDLMSCAKALQVGASVASKKLKMESGSISSTWGGGHLIDLAVGIETINLIKRRKMLSHIKKIGEYIAKRLNEIEGIGNVRGKGLMLAFDVQSKAMRNNLIVECVKNGLVLLGCGVRGVRVIPPYIITKEDVDAGMGIIEDALKAVQNKKFRHRGLICDYISCGEVHA